MALVALFLIAIVSLLIVRVGATAFRMTGLSNDVASFQAISCFFGVGFTTKEAEMIVTHPVRRKIASHLIVIGNIGILTALSALVVTFVQREPDFIDGLFGLEDASVPFPVRLIILLGGIALIVVIFRFNLVSRLLESVIKASLERAGVVRAMDFDTMLRTHSGYVVCEFAVEADHPLIGKTLGESGLGRRGVIVLGIMREGAEEYCGAPNRSTRIETGDVLTIYGDEQKTEQELTPEATRAAMDPAGGKEDQ